MDTTAEEPEKLQVGLVGPVRVLQDDERGAVTLSNFIKQQGEEFGRSTAGPPWLCHPKSSTCRCSTITTCASCRRA